MKAKLALKRLKAKILRWKHWGSLKNETKWSDPPKGLKAEVKT